MIDRMYYKGPIIVHCDGCASGYTETGSKEFQEALAIAKSEGWAAGHCGTAHGWCHFCPTCVEGRVWEGEEPDLRNSWGEKPGWQDRQARKGRAA